MRQVSNMFCNSSVRDFLWVLYVCRFYSEHAAETLIKLGDMVDGESVKGPVNWSTRELVCLVFLENFREIAMQTKLVWGDRSNEVVAFGKLGLTCRNFRAFIDDPVVPQIMDFYI